jgi:hypothetical protein
MNLIPLPQEVWDRTPPEAQAFIRPLEARVVVLEATVRHLGEAVQQLEATVQRLREQLQREPRPRRAPRRAIHPKHDQRPRRESCGRQPAAYLDETGWREGCARAWLWAAVTTWVPVCVVRLSRGARIAQELLGERCRIWYEPLLYTSAPMYR